MIDCHYRRLPGDDVYEPTDGTRGNWAPEIQHGSPPLALLTRTVEQMAWLIATGDTTDVATDRYPPRVDGPAVAVPHSGAGAALDPARFVFTNTDTDTDTDTTVHQP